MGDLVLTAVVSHQPMVMLPEEIRVMAGGTGKDTTLVEPGYRRLRELFADHDVDTLLIVDTHWFTTTEHVLAGAERFSGLYTSEELPGLISDLPYDFPGAPDLAAAVHEGGGASGVPVFNATVASLPRHYPTINLVHHLRTTESVLSVGVLQTAGPDDYLRFGQVVAEAIDASDRRVAILASGGLTHTFWAINSIGQHLGYDAANIISDDARTWDQRILDWWAAGDHASVIDAYDDYRALKPEGRFGHYLIMVGAMGGRTCTTPGTQLSDYENAIGTGQVHVAFPLSTAKEPR